MPGIKQFGYVAGNRAGIDHSYIRLVQLDLGTTAGHDFLAGVVDAFGLNQYQRIPISNFFAMCWRVKKFRFQGTLHLAWHTGVLAGEDRIIPFDFEVGLYRAVRTATEFSDGSPIVADIESDIIGVNVGLFVNPGMDDEEKAELPPMNYGFFGADVAVGANVVARMLKIAPFPSLFQEFPPEANQLYYEDRDADEDQVYVPFNLAMALDYTMHPPEVPAGPGHTVSVGLTATSVWPWVHQGAAITIPGSTPFNPTPATEDPGGFTDTALNGFYATHAGSVTMKIHGYADVIIPLLRSSFGVSNGFGGLPAIRTLEIEATLTASKFWTYGDIFDEATGALVG